MCFCLALILLSKSHIIDKEIIILRENTILYKPKNPLLWYIQFFTQIGTIMILR